MVHLYNYWVSGHYPSSCFLFKTKRFGDWILSPSSGEHLLCWAQSIELVPVSGEHGSEHGPGENFLTV
jgi:hypothetical protein